VFIKDRKLIWTHGTYYALPNDEVFVSDGQEPTGNEEIWVDLSEDSPAVDIDLSNYVTKDELIALENTKNVLKRIYIGVLNLIVGSNNSVNITNSNALSSINPFEWFTITCNLNGSDTYLHAYSDNNIIKCFRHYTNQDNNRSIAFIISDINVADSTCNIVFNDNNLVTNSNISNYVLTKTNTIEYNPTSVYHPATKKYVDDRWFDINSLILELRKYSSPHDITEFVNKTYNSWDNLSYICRNRYLYRGRNVPVNVSYNIDGGIHLVIVQQNGSPHDEGKSYLYLEHFDIYKDLDETVKGYLVQSITLGKGDGAKALMDDGEGLTALSVRH
jgi:hypothetical protein